MSIPTVATELLTGTWVGKAVQGGVWRCLGGPSARCRGVVRGRQRSQLLAKCKEELCPREEEP